MDPVNASPNTECPPDGEALDIPAVRTPFRLEEGWELAAENTNPSCSHAEIDTLLQKRILNLIDMEIMKVLSAFHYINHHSLAAALSMRLHPGYHKSSYLDNIRKLKKAGILLSYRPVRMEDAAAGHGAVPVSPVRLYCLSRGAHTYMEHISPDARPVLPSSARRKMELAAAGQFLIQFIAHYGERIQEMECQKGTRLGNTPFLLDALIRFRAGIPKLPPVSLLLLSLRRQKGWEKAALSRLHLLGIWLSRHREECMLPLPVVLVEDIAMAVSLYAEMYAAGCLPGLHVYFCPDSLLMACPPLQAVYRCETGEDGKVTALRTILEMP